VSNKKEILLRDAYVKWSGDAADNMWALPASGSYREYYRLQQKNKSVMGVYNTDLRENTAFINFSKHFKRIGLNVPEIYYEDLANNIYLEQDLGDETLLSVITKMRHGSSNDFPDELLSIYKRVIAELPKFQMLGANELDYKVCYPRQAFDRQSMMWDLNYFKYYFLKLAKVQFNEEELEEDFKTFTNFLLEADSDYFLFRDFQSRNVMIYNNEIYFIDYQGGRRGALQYDIASILYEAKTNLPQHIREELLEHYLLSASKIKTIDRDNFFKYYYGFVLIRMMQAMGAYGFRGFYEKKPLFLQSIPLAVKNLDLLLKSIQLDVKIPHLLSVLAQIPESAEIKTIIQNISHKLTISVNSFSYKRGIPVDESGNGGGFVFDCRALPNPGRLPEYQVFTGKDKEVINYFSAYPEVDTFINTVFSLVNNSVEEYRRRNFSNLMISFGCTGGQHRSVFCAERLTKLLYEKYPDINVLVRHREQEMKTVK
jgi:aminoglycoside/choline kinase family phosphotransferase